MPLYDYACKHCHQKLAVLRNIHLSDVPPSAEEGVGSPSSPIAPCSESDHVWERRIGPTSFKLEGWGWFNKGGY